MADAPYYVTQGFDNPENLGLIDAHPDAITGIYTYIGAGTTNSGEFDCPHNTSFLRAGFAPCKSTNRPGSWHQAALGLRSAYAFGHSTPTTTTRT